MRQLLAALILSLIVVLGPAPAKARTRVLVLPPDLSTRGPELLGLVADSVSQLQPGEEMYVYAARPPRQIAAIVRPAEGSMTSAKVRAAIAAPFKLVRDYITALPPGLSTEPPANLMITAVIDELSRTLLSSLPERRVDLALVGSLLYFDRRDSRTSMLDRFYPADGMLRAPKAESPFSVVGAEERLSGVNVHFCAINSATEFESSEHEERLRRFWTLYVQGQGGRVATASGDLGVCFRRFNNGEASGQPTYQMSRDTKAEMLRVPERTSATLPVRLDVPGAFFLREDVPISKSPPSATKGVLWVGIRWSSNSNVDLDLYARGEPTSSWLYFGNVRSAEGFFNKDFTTGTGDLQYEYAEFTREVDVAKAEVAVNFFAPSDAGAVPEATVRAWFMGRTYQTTIRFGAKGGNRGVTPMSGPAWVRVDLRKLLGLSSEKEP